jgi:hypothetical protein
VCLYVQLQNTPLNEADTPLHKAAIKGHEAVTRVLVEGGADVNAQDSLVKSKCAVVGCVLMGVVAEAAWWRVAACAGVHPAASGGSQRTRGSDKGAGDGRGRRECQDLLGTK